MTAPTSLRPFVVAAALAIGTAACFDSGLLPTEAPGAEAAPAPNLALVSGPACDRSQPIDAFGLIHLPSGNAQLSLTPSGGLRVSGLGESGSDGVCTRLPDVTRLHFSLGGNQPDGFGVLGPGESFRIALAGAGSWRQVCAVRGRPDGRIDLACRNEAAAGWMVQLIKDGQVVRTTRQSGSTLSTTIPGFGLTDFQWDQTDGALTIEEILDDQVQKGVMTIPITEFPSTVVSPSRMATTMTTLVPGREYVYTEGDTATHEKH